MDQAMTFVDWVQLLSGIAMVVIPIALGSFFLGKSSANCESEDTKNHKK